MLDNVSKYLTLTSHKTTGTHNKKYTGKGKLLESYLPTRVQNKTKQDKSLYKIFLWKNEGPKWASKY